MTPLRPLGLSANQWQFLSKPDAYVNACPQLNLESTRRQFLTARDILARLNGSVGATARRGVLLADDVGLGKTTVAALVAWIVASAGDRRGVRILAPNDVMVRRWEEELLRHVEPLQRCARHLDVRHNRVKARRLKQLSPGSIQIVKHSYAMTDLSLACDLLIVDEAHRAKGEKTAFSQALHRKKSSSARVLILTATPFSIRLDELRRMLVLVGANDTSGPVRSFSKALEDLYGGSAARPPEVVAGLLADKAEAAVDALAGFVIRHGIDDLPAEHSSFGGREDWSIAVPDVSPTELELILRMDRALRLAKRHDDDLSQASHDPRFHVGWRHLDAKRAELREIASHLPKHTRAVIEAHGFAIDRLRKQVGTHAKITAVTDAVKSVVGAGEKVVLFCHHHATAQELTIHLAKHLPKAAPPPLAYREWRNAWEAVLPACTITSGYERFRKAFVDWLCEDCIRAQAWRWIVSEGSASDALENALRSTRGRNAPRGPTIADAAARLFNALMDSPSSRAVLREADRRPLPGAKGGGQVLGVCRPSENPREHSWFVPNQQPDTAIAIFNSPFGPDVLVVTDKLSEGIDLHRYCRHLIHYELDPSPIRTVQRNGRLRRVNGWAAMIGREIRYAYPAFGGTRDYRLVQIMKRRIDSFSLLLGGVQDIAVDDVVNADESWRNQVIRLAKKRLANVSRKLVARDPSGE